ncbi:MAG: hypothetical protein ACLTQI_00145 [Slackia sp.]
MIEGVKDGSIDAIVTDHAPHAEWEKAHEFEYAPFGMTGLETSLALVLTNLVKPGVIDYSEMVELMAIAPREILGLEPVKIAEGSVADITVFDPTCLDRQRRRVRLESKNSGFIGFELEGRATDVFVGGVATRERRNRRIARTGFISSERSWFRASDFFRGRGDVRKRVPFFAFVSENCCGVCDNDAHVGVFCCFAQRGTSLGQRRVQ